MSSFKGAKKPSFRSVGGADISNQLVMVVQHMEDQSGATLWARRHPPALPFSQRLDLTGAWTFGRRQGQLSGEQVAEPARLEAVGEDTGNGRGIPDEGEPRQVRMQDMAVQVEAVGLELEPSYWTGSGRNA